MKSERKGKFGKALALAVLFSTLALTVSTGCVSAAAPLTDTVFTDVASEYEVDDSRRGDSAVWFDYDNDGDLDILITPDATASGDIYTALYRNDGDIFVDVADEVGLPGLWSKLSVGDYDNDGDIDILYARLFRNDINETGNFTAVGGYGQTFVDHDNDGDLDTYSALFWGSNKLFRNDGEAGFVEVPGALGLDDPSHSRTSVWGDYDDDGDMDVYLVNGRGEKCLLYRNDVDTTGLFTDVTDEMGVGDAERYANGASWADYDNDGDLDLYLNKCETGTNRLYRNDGHVFTEVAAELGVADKNDYGGFHSSWGDYDNDGDLDLYVTSRDGCPNRLYRNEVSEGNGFVETGEMQDIHGRGMGGSWGDFDGDGDLDYYLVSGYYGTVPNRLYLNNCSENGNHWLHIKAIGTISNRAAIGTKIQVVAGGLVQTRYVESTSGFGSQNSLPVEFGLGDHSTVDSVTIKWPNGIVQILTDVEVNQFLTVFEKTQIVSISTDKFEYCTGSIMIITIDIANPTKDNVTFQWYWGIPQYSIWVPIMSVPISAGYDETFNLSIPCPYFGLKPSGNAFYVQLLDGSGKVLYADAACWAYSLGGRAIAEVDITEQIKKTIERVELPS